MNHDFPPSPGRARPSGRGATRRDVHRWLATACLGAVPDLVGGSAWAAADAPVTPQQRATADAVAGRGVPLEALAPNAPERYTVRRGDTLWGIAGTFLRSPWRWPELWGMNRDQIRNPHRIYPGQELVLERDGRYARLRLRGAGGVAGPGGTVRLSPRVRASALDASAIASIPLDRIGPFLNEAVILTQDELDQAPRIVGAQEGRVLLSSGEKAYVRGDLRGASDFRLFRQARALRDPDTEQILGYEGQYVGGAHVERLGEVRSQPDGSTHLVPATVVLDHVREEATVGDRLAIAPATELDAFVPHSPDASIGGRIASVYGSALLAGNDQIVTLNRGSAEGIERGHVLARWRAGARTIDKTDELRTTLQLPDERDGVLFVFRVFDHMAYALVMNAGLPVERGDRFGPP